MLRFLDSSIHSGKTIVPIVAPFYITVIKTFERTPTLLNYLLRHKTWNYRSLDEQIKFEVNRWSPVINIVPKFMGENSDPVVTEGYHANLIQDFIYFTKPEVMIGRTVSLPCVIPRGCKFYMGDNNDVIAEQLILLSDQCGPLISFSEKSTVRAEYSFTDSVMTFKSDLIEPRVSRR